MVADARAANDPWLDCTLDWDNTIAYREYLWDLGLGVAEAMDTAQRGMGLDWPTSLELIQRAVKAGKAWEAREGRPALIFSGCGTDHLDLGKVRSVDDVIRAYEEQMAAIEKAGGRLIVMASRALARVAKSPADYERVYARVLSPGEASPSSSTGWARCSTPRSPATGAAPTTWPAMQTAVAIINAHAAKVDGVKISLLDKDKEIVMRRQLAKGVRMYTGDDFNYAELIAGDEKGYSDALLGIFDAIAPAASAALAALAAGDRERFHDILAPTVPLSRHIFKAPTRFYKTGVVFMAYLNGLQDHFVDGRRPAERALDPAPGRAVPPRRPRRPAARSGHGAPAHGARAGRARDRLMRDLAARPTAPVDQHGDGAQAAGAPRHHRGVRRARHPRHLPLARPGAGRRPRHRSPSR